MDHMAFDKKYISAVCDAVYEISKSSNTRTHYVNFELLLETMWEFRVMSSIIRKFPYRIFSSK